jgi:small acid-soluble spore protein D (minor alpha/beta-type SASP)
MSRNNNEYVGQGSNVRQAMESFKAEVANELGLTERIQTTGYENMTTRECGSIGGTMTKRMVQIAEQSLAGRR